MAIFMNSSLPFRIFLFTGGLVLVFSFFSNRLLAQGTASEFQNESHARANTGMAILGTWAAANLISGGLGWKFSTGQTRYFHQMNFFWNTVNAGISAYALWEAHQHAGDFLTPAQILTNHRELENLLLINSGLDLLYIGTGAFLLHKSKSNLSRTDLLEGYGKSLMIQGGFLLLFDMGLYFSLFQLRSDWPANFSLMALPGGMQFSCRLPIPLN